MVKSMIARHKLQQHILAYLDRHGESRFRDLRTPDVDTNLLAYHLKVLCAEGLIVKTDAGYARSGSLVGLTDERLGTRVVLVEFVVQNSNGDILLQEQPDGRWGLPRADIGVTGAPLKIAVQEVARESIGLRGVALEHAGDAYIRTRDMVRFVHVFRTYADVIQDQMGVVWARPHKLATLRLVPGTEEIMARTFFKDPFFFEDFVLT